MNKNNNNTKHPKVRNTQIVFTNSSSIFLKTTIPSHLNVEIDSDIFSHSVWNPNLEKRLIQKTRLNTFIQRYSKKNVKPKI